MSRLLVVLSDGAQLEGVVADAQRDVDGATVFSYNGREVARAVPGQRLVVRDLGVRSGACPPFAGTTATPTLAAAVR